MVDLKLCDLMRQVRPGRERHRGANATATAKHRRSDRASPRQRRQQAAPPKGSRHGRRELRIDGAYRQPGAVNDLAMSDRLRLYEERSSLPLLLLAVVPYQSHGDQRQLRRAGWLPISRAAARR